MILVTGGTGLVGAHLLLKLVSSEEKVRAIYRKENTENVKKTFSYYHNSAEAEALFNKIEWVKADITDIPSLNEAFKGIDCVYHCAAVVSFDVNDEKTLRKVNIEGTANVVNQCIFFKIKKLCYVSSIATHNKELKAPEITEESPWNPEMDHSEYAISKYGAEIEVWRGTQEGLPAVIVNPGIIIGPGNWDSGSGQLFSKVKNGLNFYFPKITGFVGVEDVVRAMVALMDSEIENEQFILVSENKSFKDVLQNVAESLGKPIPKHELKPWMVYIGWMGEAFAGIFGRKRLLKRNSAKELFEKDFYSSKKIEKAISLNFESIDAVIKDTAAIFKNENKD